MHRMRQMSFYKYVTSETLDKILNGSIRLTQPSGFNDPFELSMEVFDPYGLNDGARNFSFDVLHPRRDISKYLVDRDFSHDNCNDSFSRKVVKQLNEAIGILCLSKNEESHLMWAHYADSYRGAVIEFDSNHEFFKGAIEVNYVDERPKLHIDYFLESDPIPVSELCSKSEVWSYEKEWRIIRSLRDCTSHKAKKGQLPICVMNLPLEAIKCVTLGERSSLDTVRKTLSKLKETNIEIKLAAIDFWKYKFRYEPVKFNRPISEAAFLITPRTADLYINAGGQIGKLAKWMKEEHPFAELANSRL